MAAHDVLGRPLAPRGKILFHEHLQFGWPGFQLDPRARMSSDLDTAVSAMEELFAAGYAVFVDATPMECGRDLRLLRAVAERTRLQLVASAGLYEQQRGFPTHFASLSVEELADLYTEELTQPCAGNGYAGVLKVATRTPPLSQREARAVKAAGVASARTGAPIITHAGSIAAAREQLRILTSAGAVPEWIVLGHLDSAADDLPGLLELARTGAFIGIDRFGHSAHASDAVRIGLICEFHARGLLGSVLVSHDAPLTFLGRMTVGTPGHNPFLHLHRVAVPQLLRNGLSASDIALLLEENPRRLLSARVSTAV